MALYLVFLMAKKNNDKPKSKPTKRKPTVKQPPKRGRCKARTAQDPTKRCRLRAIRGSEYCSVHRGKNQIRSGLNNRYFVGAFGELVKDIDLDIDRHKDLTHEIHLLRTMLTLLLNKADTDDVADGAVLRYTEQIGKLAKTMEHIEHGLKLTLNPRQVATLANQIVEIINQEVDDPQVRAVISERIANLVVVDKN